MEGLLQLMELQSILSSAPVPVQQASDVCVCVSVIEHSSKKVVLQNEYLTLWGGPAALGEGSGNVERWGEGQRGAELEGLSGWRVPSQPCRAQALQ